MSEEERIHVEEDVAGEEPESEQREWTEEFRVAGEELLETVKEVVREAGVRRVVVKNNKGRVLIEIPVWVGVAGIALLPTLSALGLIAALATECSIVVVRAKEKAPAA